MTLPSSPKADSSRRGASPRLKWRYAAMVCAASLTASLCGAEQPYQFQAPDEAHRPCLEVAPNFRAELLRILDILREGREGFFERYDWMELSEQSRASEIVWDVGLSGHRGLAPLVAEIAETALDTKYTSLSSVALRSLMRLGDQDAYLEVLVERYATNPRLAAAAMGALLTQPDPERTSRFLDIAQEAQGRIPARYATRLQNGARESERILKIAIRNRSRPSLDDRVGELLYHAGALRAAFCDHGFRRLPGSWYAEELERLSRENPQAVAEAYARADLREYRALSNAPRVTDTFLPAIKEVSSRYLAPECRVIWRSLEPPEEVADGCGG